MKASVKHRGSQEGLQAAMGFRVHIQWRVFFPVRWGAQSVPSLSSTLLAQQTKQAMHRHSRQSTGKQSRQSMALKLFLQTMQAILPVVREIGEKKGHVRQEALVTRLTLVAAAPWRVLSPRLVCTAFDAIWSVRFQICC